VDALRKAAQAVVNQFGRIGFSIGLGVLADTINALEAALAADTGDRMESRKYLDELRNSIDTFTGAIIADQGKGRYYTPQTVLKNLEACGVIGTAASNITTLEGKPIDPKEQP